MRVFLIIISFMVNVTLYGQSTELPWKTLSEATIEYRFNDDFGFEVPYPIFSDHLISFHKKRVRISGFAIILKDDNGEDIIILSKFNYSNCFFCGGAGPDSVIEVETPKDYTEGTLLMDDKIEIDGVLYLNKDDFEHLNFILKDVSIKFLDN